MEKFKNIEEYNIVQTEKDKEIVAVKNQILRLKELESKVAFYNDEMKKIKDLIKQLTPEAEKFSIKITEGTSITSCTITKYPITKKTLNKDRVRNAIGNDELFEECFEEKTTSAVRITVK